MPTISKDLVNHLNITEADAGQRLDNYLIKVLKGVPKSHIQRIIRAGEVRLNKKRCKGTDRLAEGDVLRIPPIRIAEKQRPSESSAAPAREFEIVYEDDAMLVINKPVGLVVHPGAGNHSGTLVNALLFRDPSVAVLTGSPRYCSGAAWPGVSRLAACWVTAASGGSSSGCGGSTSSAGGASVSRCARHSIA